MRVKQVQYLGVPLLFLILALGAPDRSPLLPILSYVFGYSGFIYLLLSLEKRKNRFLFAFSFAFLLQMVQLSWLSTTHYHGMGIVAVYLGVCSIIALHIALTALILPAKGGMTLLQALAFASCWTLFEYSRLYYSCGFPFNPAGLVMTFEPNFFQLAALFGIYGLTFWVIFTGALGASFLHNKQGGAPYLWMGALLFPYFFGVMHIYVRDGQMQKGEALQVALVQTGLSVENKWAVPGAEDEAIEELDQWKKIFASLEQKRRGAFDLILLPEVALPGNAFDPSLSFDEVTKQVFQTRDRLPLLEEPFAKKIGGSWFVSNVWMAQALANHYRSEVVIGLVDHEGKSNRCYNSAFHFQPFKTKVVRYDKRVLVPLAEYLPFRVMASFLEKFGITAFFTPGQEAKVFYGQVPLAPSICYEEGFSGLIREARKKGANILLNLSNDGWFPNSRLPREHFNLGRIRAIENGTPVLRACNTGITAAIDPLGRVVGEMREKNSDGSLLAGALVLEIKQFSYPTLYTYGGDAIILILSLFFFALEILPKYRLIKKVVMR